MSGLPSQVTQALQGKNIGFYPTHSSNVATLPQFATNLKKNSQLETVDISSRSSFSKDADVTFGQLRFALFFVCLILIWFLFYFFFFKHNEMKWKRQFISFVFFFFFNWLNFFGWKKILFWRLNFGLFLDSILSWKIVI